MSIEAFLLNHPPDSQLKWDFGELREPNTSSVATFAMQFAKAGAEGLRTKSRSLTPSGIVENNQEIFKKLTQIAIRDIGAILLGLGIKSVEEILVDKVYSHDDFLARLSFLLQGSIIPTLSNQEIRGNEEITLDRWKEMIAVQREDKTLAIFFFERTNLLPQKLYEFLGQKQGIGITIGPLIPDYRLRAKFLLGKT